MVTPWARLPKWNLYTIWPWFLKVFLSVWNHIAGWKSLVFFDWKYICIHDGLFQLINKESYVYTSSRFFHFGAPIEPCLGCFWPKTLLDAKGCFHSLLSSFLLGIPAMHTPLTKKKQKMMMIFNFGHLLFKHCRTPFFSSQIRFLFSDVLSPDPRDHLWVLLARMQGYPKNSSWFNLNTFSHGT